VNLVRSTNSLSRPLRRQSRTTFRYVRGTPHALYIVVGSGASRSSSFPGGGAFESPGCRDGKRATRHPWYVARPLEPERIRNLSGCFSRFPRTAASIFRRCARESD